MTNIYLAGSYARKIELQGYRSELRPLGFNVTSSWLDEQIENDGLTHPENIELSSHIARVDFMEILNVDHFIAFAEPPGSPYGRGGRHVEAGIVIGLNSRGKTEDWISLHIVGYRENIYSCCHFVEFHPTWADCKKYFSRLVAKRNGVRIEATKPTTPV